MTTDVMVGPHGAGLTHTVFMPDRAHLVEIFVDGSTGLVHFNNMHSWRHSQKKYHPIQNSNNPVDVELVFKKVLRVRMRVRACVRVCVLWWGASPHERDFSRLFGRS